MPHTCMAVCSGLTLCRPCNREQAAALQPTTAHICKLRACLAKSARSCASAAAKRGSALRTPRRRSAPRASPSCVRQWSRWLHTPCGSGSMSRKETEFSRGEGKLLNPACAMPCWTEQCCPGGPSACRGARGGGSSRAALGRGAGARARRARQAGAAQSICAAVRQCCAALAWLFGGRVRETTLELAAHAMQMRQHGAQRSRFQPE